MDIFDNQYLQPQKVFHSWLTSALCVRPYQLYGEYGKEVLKQEEFIKAKIYFIAELEKIRFIPNATRISRNGIISFSFLIGNNKNFTLSTTIPILMYKNKLPKDFRSLMFGVKNLEHYRKLISSSKFPFTGICLNEKSNQEKIVMNLYAPNIETTIDIPPHNVLLYTETNIEIYPKIVYIGQSKNIQKRTSGHEKIQRALSEVSDNKDIYLYFFDFDAKAYFLNLPPEQISDIDFKNPLKIDSKGMLNLVEMALINYFKPKYNKLLSNADIPLNKQVERLMKKNKYTKITIDVSFETDFWKFGSDVVKNQSDHYISHDLPNPFLEFPS